MTRKGFMNLSESEQNRVYQAALDEFARADFTSASLNQIIQNAGISKGSMYHYFENKEDLYFYILERAMSDKAVFLKQSLRLDRPIEEFDFFEKIRLMMQASIRFAQEYPRYQKMNNHVQNMPAGPFKERVWDQFNRGFDDFIQHMVDQAVLAGELRNDLDEAFIINVLRFLMLRFTDFFPKNDMLHPDQADTIDHDLQQLIEFLKTGLRKENNHA